MDARANIIGLANEAWVSRCLHVVAMLDVADVIGDGPRTVQDIAADLRLDARILGTILRVLSHRGIFAVDGEWVSQTEASSLLRSDNPVTLTDIVRWCGSDESWLAFGKLPAAAKTGTSGFEIAFGQRLFNHLSSEPEIQNVFNRSMEGFTKRQVSSIIEALDFSPYRDIIDIAGGTGLLASSLAQAYPGSCVSIFELPGVVKPGSIPAGIRLYEGDFFVAELPAFDLAILMNVLHDWRDDEAKAILGSIRKTARPASRLMLIEGLMSSGGGATDLLDLGMAVMTGGIQRARHDFEDLLAATDFALCDEVVCSEHLSALIARPI